MLHWLIIFEFKLWSGTQNNFLRLKVSKKCNFRFPRPGTSDVIRCVNFDCFTSSQCISYNVSTLTEPACVLASDRQVQDVKQFCANTTSTFLVLSIDTTFNISDFYVTPTTGYRHLLLEDRRTGKPPLLLGPALIHTRKNSDTLDTTLEPHSLDLTTAQKTYDLLGQTVKTQSRREWVLIFP